MYKNARVLLKSLAYHKAFTHLKQRSVSQGFLLFRGPENHSSCVCGMCGDKLGKDEAGPQNRVFKHKCGLQALRDVKSGVMLWLWRCDTDKVQNGFQFQGGGNLQNSAGALVPTSVAFQATVGPASSSSSSSPPQL